MTAVIARKGIGFWPSWYPVHVLKLARQKGNYEKETKVVKAIRGASFMHSFRWNAPEVTSIIVGKIRLLCRSFTPLSFDWREHWSWGLSLFTSLWFDTSLPAFHYNDLSQMQETRNWHIWKWFGAALVCQKKCALLTKEKCVKTSSAFLLLFILNAVWWPCSKP